MIENIKNHLLSKHNYTINEAEEKILNDLMLTETEKIIIEACDLLLKNKKNKITKFARREIFLNHKRVFQINLPEWTKNLPADDKDELIEAHFIISDYVFGYTPRNRIDWNLLGHLYNYYKKKVPFHIQIEIIKRNNYGQIKIPISKTELYALFEIEELFLEQARIIYKSHESFKKQFAAGKIKIGYSLKE